MKILFANINLEVGMQTQLKKLAMVMVPMVLAAPAVAEKGFLHEGTDPGSVVRTGYGECWTTSYRDPGFPIDPTCFGDADGDGVADPSDKCPDTPEGTKVDADGCALDSDGDGVTDDKDKCPGTPKGTKVDADGCALDSDGDGVVDAKDKCPGTPAGAKVDANGCALDSDGDGVADYKDQCPGTPAGAKVDTKGCASQIILRNVNFELNSNQLTTESMVILDGVASSLKSRADISGIQVIGHTDSSGSAAYNQTLSEKRAQAVADYLVSQGVESGSLSSKGMGESQPIADNSTSEGRASNRRVELQVK
ncbi:MAG: OmpA family protein [Gammaproteobacteria bacterium]|nr:OmpA family protein [Gammaproteobacteria bacterium]